MRRFALPLAVLVLAALPAEAAADVFRGRTGQSRLAYLVTSDAGPVVEFGVNWSAPCRRPGSRYTHSTKFLTPYDFSTRDRFVDEDGYRERFDNGIRAILNARVAGNRVSERRWRGIFRIRVRVFRGSRLVTRCYKRTSWRVVRR